MIVQVFLSGHLDFLRFDGLIDLDMSVRPWKVLRIADVNGEVRREFSPLLDDVARTIEYECLRESRQYPEHAYRWADLERLFVYIASRLWLEPKPDMTWDEAMADGKRVQAENDTKRAERHA